MNSSQYSRHIWHNFSAASLVTIGYIVILSCYSLLNVLQKGFSNIASRYILLQQEREKERSVNQCCIYIVPSLCWESLKPYLWERLFSWSCSRRGVVRGEEIVKKGSFVKISSSPAREEGISILKYLNCTSFELHSSVVSQCEFHSKESTL